MTVNRAVVVFGGLAILVGTAVMRSQVAGERLQQSTGTGPATVHSIKVSLVPSASGEGCRLQPVSPKEGGVYAADLLRFNVENGCKIDATISIGDFTQRKTTEAPVALFDEREKWPKTLTVKPLQRGFVEARVSTTEPSGSYCFDFTIALPDSPPPGMVSGSMCYCRFPPCPPGS